MTGSSIVPYQKKNPVRRSRAELAKRVSKIQYLVEPEYVALLSAAKTAEHKLLIRLLWETGLRISEALSLSYDRIYPDGINVINGKGGKQRFVPCQAPVLGELLRYSATHKQGMIFQKIKTEPGVLYMLRRTAKLAGIEKRIFPHLFRHSFAINFIQQTGNPFALQDIGGWSDMETIKIYMRLAKEAPTEAINRMRFPSAI